MDPQKEFQSMIDSLHPVLKKAVESGENIFLSGAGGTGKSHAFRRMFLLALQKYFTKPDPVQFCSSTGVSAVNLSFQIGPQNNKIPYNARTIHSIFGVLPSGVKNEQDFLDKISDSISSMNEQLIRDLHVLFIDEVSMISRLMLDMINIKCKLIRKNDKPFGGVQVIFSGDMCQLPPTITESQTFYFKNDSFCFESNAWKEADLQYYKLTKNHRTGNNLEWAQVLNKLRIGENIKEELQELYTTNIQKKIPSSTIRLYSANAKVDMYNTKMLQQLTTKLHVFSTQDFEVERREDNTIFMKPIQYTPKGVEFRIGDETQELKAGARVMYLKNNLRDGLSNGSRGVITQILGNSGEESMSRYYTTKIIVKFDDDVGRRVIQYDCETVWFNERCFLRYSMPLKLCWAMSVHKSQGMSLDTCVVGLDFAHEHSIPYTALSRCKDPSTIYFDEKPNINGVFKGKKVWKPHPLCLVFEQKFNKNAVQLE